MTEAPEGGRYSLSYQDKAAPGKDSPRARNRTYHVTEHLLNELNVILNRYSGGYIAESSVSDLLRREIGVKISSLQEHFQRCGIVDFLDSITFTYQFFVGKKSISDKASVFLTEVRRIFSETNLSYRIDDRGGVHPFVDREFEANRVAAISNLSEARFGGALVAFDAAYQAFESNPVRGKEALRNIFESAEIVFKLAFPRVNRLGDGS